MKNMLRKKINHHLAKEIRGCNDIIMISKNDS